jgi:hypothetical protein
MLHARQRTIGDHTVSGISVGVARELLGGLEFLG